MAGFICSDLVGGHVSVTDLFKSQANRTKKVNILSEESRASGGKRMETEHIHWPNVIPSYSTSACFIFCKENFLQRLRYSAEST
jgi:hypothetical protein